MDLGVHLPQVDLTGEGLSLRRVTESARAARDAGYAAVSANDHLFFSRPWLDGLTALAAVVEHSGDLELATTVALPTVRGPLPLAKALTALDVVSGGRVVAGIGAGSSRTDLAAVGVDFDDRWRRLDLDAALLRQVLRGEPAPGGHLEPGPVRPGGIPLWLASWGSPAGLRRVARRGEGWLASAYHTDPERFRAGRSLLREALAEAGRDDLPAALATMWTWVTEDEEEAAQVLRRHLAPMLSADPDALLTHVCVGPAGRCAELLSAYAEAGCSRVYLWPIGEDPRQLELVAEQVLPRL
ncbi:LLM class flavin-dependent oxidoreductase [Nocardioides sp. GXQ0305]|uniref:LLM class flavin-dependent oxidoreductase n=1 Tax=Nocardioides sp. GXQ0305 TaxID=3423912 RepID=UPI003D7CCF3B